MTPLAVPATDLHARLRGAGLSEPQAEAIAAGFEAVDRRVGELERRMDRVDSASRRPEAPAKGGPNATRTELFTLWVIGTVLWALIAFLIVVAQPIEPGGGERIGLTAFLLFMLGPPLAVPVAILLFVRRSSRGRR